MKKILLALSILLSVTLFGQQEKIYYIEDLNVINDSISKRMESYVHTFSHSLSRISELDKRAKMRNSYFLSVIQKTSETGKSFSSIVDSIPSGKTGHTKCFGNPNYFSSAEIQYPELFPVLLDSTLKVRGEIMYQIVWSNTLPDRQTSHNKLMQKAVSDIKERYGVDKLSQKVIAEYRNSRSHNDIIIERGNGKYGTSTMAIITEKKLPDGRWSYEIMFRNLIIFTEPIN